MGLGLAKKGLGPQALAHELAACLMASVHHNAHMRGLAWSIMLLCCRHSLARSFRKQKIGCLISKAKQVNPLVYPVIHCFFLGKTVLFRAKNPAGERLSFDKSNLPPQSQASIWSSCAYCISRLGTLNRCFLHFISFLSPQLGI